MCGHVRCLFAESVSKVCLCAKEFFVIRVLYSCDRIQINLPINKQYGCNVSWAQMQ